MTDDHPHCTVCGSPDAIFERLVGMVGEDELVELVCYEHRELET